MVTVRQLGADRYSVRVDEDGSSTVHTVRVSPQDLARWAGGGSGEDLVRRSFQFLLAHESKESILREFDLSVIQRYFPEYDAAMRA
jgi:hypothetical protein